jgi:multidrug efflux pump subunit AcrA (membrane-fusion protein)
LLEYTEVDVDNRGGELLPGAYAQVHLELAAETHTTMVPVSALIFQSAGLRVATIGRDDRIRLVPVVPGRDFGNEVEIVAGLTATERRPEPALECRRPKGSRIPGYTDTSALTLGGRV